MATAVAVMDRPEFGANTDVLVVADADLRRLLWVPRDLWCERLGNRVNRAYARGGHAALAKALDEHGIIAEHSVCLLPAAIEAAIAGVEIVMPVSARQEFWYPLEPLRPIHEGRKRIVFEPPVERLAGERVHQWLGARYHADGRLGSDLDRIARQQELVAVLLGDGFGFGRALAEPDAVRISSPAALGELGAVAADWGLEALGGLADAVIEGKRVLVRAAD